MLDLLFHSARVHTHLDWHDPDGWLDSYEPLMRLSWDGERLVGLVAASVPLNHTCWIRLAAVDDRVAGQAVLADLWAGLRADLRACGAESASLLIINDWLLRYIPDLGFRYEEEVVTLRRTGWNIPPLARSSVVVRSTELTDLERIVPVDQSAFTAPWQLSLTDLRQAYRIAAHCTVALLDGAIVGYQLSTTFRSTGHLARLAVLPSIQGQGVGSALLDDLIRRYWRHDIQTVTVNTQSGNLRSQRLYHHYGFRRNGYDLAVWKATL